ncbi:MAG: L-rhamnose mutarotase [Clostridiales bacterium]|jgi:L-rhamnose mutarotase|nr:L-rhamnose mutarotase [Clostridiales bacterium]
MERYLMVIRIKPECRDAYIAIHKNPWPEMLDALRNAGFTNEIIWYFDDQSIIYMECEEGTHEECDARLRATSVCKRWDLEMVPRFAAEPVMPEKIFDLRRQLIGLPPSART